jgi:hypothetical protein
MSRGWFERAIPYEYALERVAFFRRRRQEVPLSCGDGDRGRVAQLARARRLQRQTGATFPSSGDQQEQPFVQVSAEYSLSSK